MSERTIDAATGSWAQALWRRKVQVGIGLLVVLIVGAIASRSTLSARSMVDVGPTFVAKRGPLTISVSESGTINSREKLIVKNQVEGRSTILWIVPEGTHVKEGDPLFDLDASRFEEEKVQQQILVLNAEASFVHARENLAVVQSQAESDVSKAELEHRFAIIDLEKYLKGEYPQARRQAEAEITLAREELQRSQDKLDWSNKLAAEGYVTSLELQADQLAFNRDKLDLELAQGNLALLEQYQHQRDLAQAESNVEQTKQALERAKRKAAADIAQAEANFKAREAEFERQKSKLEKLNDQIAKCKVKAPGPGMVVYATTGRGGWRGNEEPLREGREVWERQELIHLPVTNSMMAEIKIHESSLRKVQIDMPVRVTVDALPGRTFAGRVGKIGLLPDAQSVWLNPDLKVYNTEIYLDGDTTELRPGMTCRAEIVVEHYPDALYVPVQAVTRVGGKPVVYVASLTGSELREVEVGLDNNQMIHVLSGLKEGERVLLAPPLTGGQSQAAAEPAEQTAASQPAEQRREPGDAQRSDDRSGERPQPTDEPRTQIDSGQDGGAAGGRQAAS